ncbi:MAG: hypothetical protein ACRD0Q_12205 [Acidimicrobiales bacterium]
MARILDTVPAFEGFARKAGLESPFRRELMIKESYEEQHPDVFAAFNPRFGSPGGRAVIARELTGTRDRVRRAQPLMTEAIENVDPLLPGVLGLADEPSPLHVLMVGQFSTNAAVGRLGDDVAVFHCLEWFESAEGAPVLVAHEGTHAWHQLALGAAAADLPADDLAWMAFSEGLATRASRAAVPDRPELDYFWYGHDAPEDWLAWCQEHHDELLKHFRASLDIAEATETFFGGGLVDGHWRVGYYLADSLVAGLGVALPELVAMTVDEARSAIRTAVG